MKSSLEDRSFVISCAGAYNDSGVGTGGFVCVHQGEKIVTIDTIDSTGLCLGKSEDRFYRFIRSMKSIVGYSMDGIASVLRLPTVHDVHDIALIDGHFVCVSTGNNEILWFDLYGNLVKRWKAQGHGDAWHLNCLFSKENHLYVSAFGEFESHRGWVGKTKANGFILDLDTEEKVLEGLSGPHNPRFLDGCWFVCDSHTNSLLVQRSDGISQYIQLNAFTRGLSFDEDFIFVGENANRKVAKATDCSYIAVLDRESYQVLHRIEVPFPEIYDILPISLSLSQAIVDKPSTFQFSFDADRIAALERQVSLNYEAYRKELSRNKSHSLISKVRQRIKKMVR
jgi:hypothetical protein